MWQNTQTVLLLVPAMATIPERAWRATPPRILAVRTKQTQQNNVNGHSSLGNKYHEDKVDMTDVKNRRGVPHFKFLGLRL